MHASPVGDVQALGQAALDGDPADAPPGGPGSGAAALKYLRTTFPDVPFVGMEPAVKPAAETTHTGVVGVLATPATCPPGFRISVLFHSTRRRSPFRVIISFW